MSDELIDQYIDRKAFASDTDFAITQLERFVTSFNQVKGVKTKLNISSSFKDVAEGAELGIKANANMVESVKAVNKIINERFASEAKLAALQVQNGKVTSDYAKATAANNIELQKANKELKDEVAYRNANTGSIEKAQAAVKLLNAEVNKLNLYTKEGRAERDKLNSQIDTYNKFIKDNKDQLSQQKINIGNYQGSAKIIVDALEQERKKLIELEKTRTRVQNAGAAPLGGVAASRTTVTGFAGGSADAAGLSAMKNDASDATAEIARLDAEIEKSRTIVEGFSRVTEQPKFLNISAKVGDASQELKFFTKALIEMEQKGQGNSQAAVELRKRLAELTDQIGDARAEIKALSSDTRSFDLFAGSVSFAADAFQTFAGVAALAGANEEEAAEATKKLVAIQSVANGVKGIANELTTKGTAANKLLTGAQKLYTFAVGESTGAMKIFRTALLGLGITAIVFALYEAAKALDLFGDAAKDAADAQQALDDETTKYIDDIEKLNKLSAEARNRQKGGLYDQERELKLLKDKKASNGEIYAAELNLSKLKEQQSSRDFESAKLDIDRAKSRGASQEVINKLTSDAIAKEKAYKDSIAETAGVSERFGVNEQERKKNASKEAQKATEERLKNQLDAEKRDAAASKQIAIDKANELIRINQRIVDNENSSLEDKNGSLQTISEQQKILAGIEFAGAVESQEKVEQGKRVIVERSQKEIEAATLQFNNKIKAINDDLLHSQQDAQKENTEKNKAEYEKERQAKLDSLDTSTQALRDADKVAYNQAIISLNNRKLSQEDYNKERAKLDIDYQTTSLQREINYQKDLLKLIDLPQDQRAEALRRLSDLEKDLSDTTKQTHLKNEQDKLDATLKRLNTVKEGSEKVFGFIDGLLGAQETSTKNKLKKESDEAEAKASKDIELVNASGVAEEEKAAKVQLINARLAAQKDQIAQKEKRAEEARAKFQKSVAIFNIILTTTQAVIKAWATGLTPFDRLAGAIAAGVAGAAELAVAIATPIPKYFKGKGKGDKYQGLATVNEVRREVIQRSDGTIEMPTGRNVLTYIGRNDIIHPSISDWQDIALNAAVRDTMRPRHTVRESGPAPITLDQESKRLLKQIADKKELYLGSTDRGMVALWRYGASNVKYTDENTNW